jgi:hypothetical protein
MNVVLRELFIDNGAYPYARDKNGQVPTCYELGETKGNNESQIKNTIATKNMTDYFDKKWGSESLKYMFEKDKDGFKLYLKQNQNVSFDKDTTGSTLLHNLVFLHRNTKCIDYVNAFLEAYPDVDLEMKNGKGQTVLDIAIDRKDKIMENVLSNIKHMKDQKYRKNKERIEREENDKLIAQQIQDKDNSIKREQSKIQEKDNLLQEKTKKSLNKRSSKKQKPQSYYDYENGEYDENDEYERPRQKKSSKKGKTLKGYQNAAKIHMI